MKKLIFVLLLLFIGCTAKIAEEGPSLGYSYLPQKLDMDSLMPEMINVVDSSLKDFESISLDTGKLITVYKDTLRIPSGVLISERKAALFIYYRTRCEYLYKKASLTNRIYTDLYSRSAEAEKLYQDEVKKLNKQKPNWLERNLIYFGFVGGILTAILTEFAVLQTSR
jgi:hypothetical protein